MPDLLEVEGLEIRYGGVPAVRSASFGVGAGEIVGLVGPNGAGKSTTLHAIMGVVAAERGDMRLGGRSLRLKGRKQRNGRQEHTTVDAG